jgi:hypothetical protein
MTLDQVERTLFCIPRSYLTRDSAELQNRLMDYDAQQRSNAGVLVPSAPLRIRDEGVRSVDFGRLLAALDPL